MLQISTKFANIYRRCCRVLNNRLYWLVTFVRVESGEGHKKGLIVNQCSNSIGSKYVVHLLSIKITFHLIQRIGHFGNGLPDYYWENSMKTRRNK